MWLLRITSFYKAETYEKDNYDAYMHEESWFLFYLKDNFLEIERILRISVNNAYHYSEG